jgi:hypothetical protein
LQHRTQHPATDACTRPRDAAPGVIRTAKDYLAKANEPRLEKALTVLEDAAAGDGEERESAAEAFQTTCFDLGWDYPEG